MCVTVGSLIAFSFPPLTPHYTAQSLPPAAFFPDPPSPLLFSLSPFALIVCRLNWFWGQKRCGWPEAGSCVVEREREGGEGKTTNCGLTSRKKRRLCCMCKMKDPSEVLVIFSFVVRPTRHVLPPCNFANFSTHTFDTLSRTFLRRRRRNDTTPADELGRYRKLPSFVAVGSAIKFRYSPARKYT